MAYELVKPEGEEQKKNEEEIDPRDKKGWEPPPWARARVCSPPAAASM